MFDALTELVTRRRFLSLVPLFLLVLSLGSVFLPKTDASTDLQRENSAGAMLTPTPDYGEKGKWDVIDGFTDPIVAAHVSVLPNGKLLAWGPPPLVSPYPQPVQVWDPNTPCPDPPDPKKPQCVEEVLNSTDLGVLYCSGHSFLPDGKLVITGGSMPPLSNTLGIDKAVLFDYTNNSWTPLPAMNDRRWYPTNLSLPGGGVLVWGGATTLENVVNSVPQVLEKQADGTYTWRPLNNFAIPETSFKYYSWLNLLSTGKALHSVGITKTSYLLNVGGTFRYGKDIHYAFPFNPSPPAPDGQLNTTHDAGTTITFDKDQIMVVGGNDPPTRIVETINLNNSNPQWQKVGRLNIERRWPNATILPDGKVLVTGGNKGASFNNSCPENSVKVAELWDPADPGTADQDGKWKLMAAATERRIYHSTAALMPDGRVFTGGTTALAASKGCDPPSDNFVIEVFSPPYLFNSDGSPASRPEIISGPSQVNYGQTVQYTVTGAGSNPKVSLVRLPSVTHAFNQSQGFLKLTPTGTGPYSITIPGNRNELVPGHYMMFFLTSAGVPSKKAKIIQIL